ncbi:hypothetical protein [Nonomuraea sp. NPDC023979]|uniref:hypothetical protein n=1 Tax=Nonomuraea sp. NPDC023979 TaxID=3154796 RepID=UPI0033C1BFA4
MITGRNWLALAIMIVPACVTMAGVLLADVDRALGGVIIAAVILAGVVTGVLLLPEDEPAPDPWEPTRAAIRTQQTPELLARYREIRRYAALGSAVQLHEEVFEPAIRAELARRGVSLCSCPTPDGPHSTTCQETR